MLLLYVGLYAFKHLHRNLYENFLLLFCGIYILSDESLIHLREVAELCVRNFVAHSAQLDYEHAGRLIKTRHTYLGETDIEFSEPHNDWNENGDQYSCLKTKNFLLSSQREADSFFRAEDGDIATLVNIVHTPHDVTLVGHRFTTIQDYFRFPMNSSDLGICKFSVVEDKDGGVFVVATKWISKDETKYSPGNNSPSNLRLIMTLATPKPDWQNIALQTNHGSFGTYHLADKAHKKLCKGGSLESGVDTDYTKLPAVATNQDTLDSWDEAEMSDSVTPINLTYDKSPEVAQDEESPAHPTALLSDSFLSQLSQATSHQPGKPTKITIDMLSLPNPKSLSAELNNNPKSLSAELNNNNIHTQKTTAQCMPGGSKSLQESIADVVAESDTVLLQNLNTKVDNLTRLMNRVVLKLFPEEANAIVVQRPDTPLADEEAFKNLNDWLDDRSNFAHMQHHLHMKAKNTTNEKECATLLMNKVFSRDL
ncbi:hypothetical protein FOCC_FOCC014641 [Frankliniella occidentalis]|nr:hypothetical protein FOCC_FOCC014641 [Frankliniella occidentalis]